MKIKYTFAVAFVLMCMVIMFGCEESTVNRNTSTVFGTTDKREEDHTTAALTTDDNVIIQTDNTISEITTDIETFTETISNTTNALVTQNNTTTKPASTKSPSATLKPTITVKPTEPPKSDAVTIKITSSNQIIAKDEFSKGEYIENPTINQCISLIKKYFPNEVYTLKIDFEYSISRFEVLYKKETFDNPELFTTALGYSYCISYVDTKGKVCNLILLSYVNEVFHKSSYTDYVINDKTYKRKNANSVTDRFDLVIEKINNEKSLRFQYRETKYGASINPPFDPNVLEMISFVKYNK